MRDTDRVPQAWKSVPVIGVGQGMSCHAPWGIAIEQAKSRSVVDTYIIRSGILLIIN